MVEQMKNGNQRSAMISPVGRSPVCHMNGINGNVVAMRSNDNSSKNGKDKVISLKCCKIGSKELKSAQKSQKESKIGSKESKSQNGPKESKSAPLMF